MILRTFLSTVLLASLLFGCGGSDPEFLDGRAAEIYGGECSGGNGNSVTIYSGRTENLINPVLEAFACETGTSVQVRWGSSINLALLLNEEGSKTQADVFLSRSPGPVGYLESKDLLGQIGEDVLSLVDEQNHSATGTWVGFSGRKRVLVYNTDEFSPETLPDSVFDLTDPKFKGKVAIPGTNGSFVDWFTVFIDQYGEDTATQWLNDMVDNDAKYYPNNRSIVEAAGRGEISMGLVNHYYNYQEAAALGNEHRAVNYDFPSDDIGSLLIITAATILETAKDKDASNELIAYLLTPQAQDYFSNRTFEYPLAKGSKPNSILPALEALEIGSVDFDSLGGGFEETERIVRESGILN